MTRSKCCPSRSDAGSPDQRKASLRIVAFTLTLLVSLSACAVNAVSSAASSAADKATRAPAAVAMTGKSESLLLQGYNYTDHYIDNFSVNGQGGGNLFESSPTSGGGGSVCCVVWQPGSKLPVKIKVRWVAGYCMYSEKNPYPFGEQYHEMRRSLWKEQDVLIADAVAENARALEVHFYKDGRVEAAVTQGDSPPRLKLPREENRSRPGASQEFPRCPNEKK